MQKLDIHSAVRIPSAQVYLLRIVSVILVAIRLVIAVVISKVPVPSQLFLPLVSLDYIIIMDLFCCVNSQLR